MPPPAISHVTFLVPLCWALRAAGHEVLVAAQPDVLPTALGAGLNVAPVGPPAALMAQAQRQMSEEMFPATAYADRESDLGRYLWQGVAGQWAGHATTYIADYLEVARAWQPDVLLSDPINLAARLIAGALKLPLVSLRWGVDPTSGPFEEAAVARLAKLCGEHGFAELQQPDLLIDPCPPSLQAADAPPGQVVRYTPYNGTGELPEWAISRGDRPLIAICFGSAIMSLTGVGLIQRVLEAVTDVDADVVVAITAVHRETVGELPEHVRVVESLPLSLFLGVCDVLVHHGGAGTGLTATALGVPQLVMPQWTDQFHHGTGVANYGAGITVPDRDGQYDIPGIRAALVDLITNPNYREAAIRLRAENDASPPMTTVVPLIEALTASPALESR